MLAVLLFLIIRRITKRLFSVSLVHLIASGVKVAGVGECSISVVPGVVQIRIVFHIYLLITKYGETRLAEQDHVLSHQVKKLQPSFLAHASWQV